MQQALLHLILWALIPFCFMAATVGVLQLFTNSHFPIQNPKSKIQNGISHGWSPAIKLPLLGICTALLIVACGGDTANKATIGGAANTDLAANASECRVVKHELGETKVCGQPKKVVAFGPYMLDLLLSLGVQPAGYADVFPWHRGTYFDRPSQQIPYLGNRVTSKPLNLGLRDAPSLEALSQLKPDLILSEAGGMESRYPLLSQIAPTLFFEHRIIKDRWQQSIQAIAQALGRSEQVPRVIASHNQLLAAARAELAPVVAAHPHLLLLGGDQLNQNIRLFDRNEYVGGLLADVGFQIVALPGQENTERATFISLEVLPSLKAADTIIVLGYALDPKAHQGNVLENQLKNLKQEWSKNALAQSLPASQEGRVYFVTYYLWNGLNGPIGAELILKELHQLLL
ncbi:iron-siderophore ABC transporter substrate-binding protein [Chroococcidiopsis sp. CCMEE 29]|uniref:ABC transporter substrate-binding protein n=1 Tax=Chroococcidiopsis sp. CCMEE 29 TaxID=155894 RepID=UPI002021D019|nr:iron-siderophore ABC transporter substrate-binding protein [Chroococcidiopsis sp. CCMEE 29]